MMAAAGPNNATTVDGLLMIGLRDRENRTQTNLPARAEISRRMLRRLEDIDNATTAGPTTPTARAALASSVIAHAVVELETALLELKTRPGTK